MNGPGTQTPKPLPPPPPGVTFTNDTPTALPPPPPGVTFTDGNATPAAAKPPQTLGDRLAGGLEAHHPVLAAIARPVGNAVQSAGQELTNLPFRVAEFPFDKNGALGSKVIGRIETARQKVAGPPVAGPGVGTGRFIGGTLPVLYGGIEAEALAKMPTALRIVANIARNAGLGGALSVASGGNPVTGMEAGGLGAGVGEATPALARPLKNLAGKSMLRAIYPTGAADKFAARRIVGDILDRGIFFRNSDSLARQGAEGAQLYGQRLGDALDNMIAEANTPKPGQLALPPPPRPVEELPLHDASAVVERPSLLQPAGRPIVRDGSYIASPATVNIPGATSGQVGRFAQMQTPAESRAAGFLDRLESEGGNGITYPEGRMPDGAVAHPQQEPLRTTRKNESAQGVLLRPASEPPAAPAVERPLTATQPLIDDLERFKNSFTTSRGVPASPSHEAAMNYVGQLQDVLRAHGDHISYRDLNGLRRMYDEAVAARGGYAGKDLLTTMHASAEKQAANIFREELAKDHPDIAALNKEFSFWATVRNIGEHASLRKVGQQGGLARTVTDPLLALAGFGIGGPAGAVAPVVLNEAIRSPLWKSWSAVQRSHLADALARGDGARAAAMLGRFAATAHGSPETAPKHAAPALKGIGRLQ